eukprot:scaffold2927_cov408-Prasinococcus_capsulatus_cf.AAC.18
MAVGTDSAVHASEPRLDLCPKAARWATKWGTKDGHGLQRRAHNAFHLQQPSRLCISSSNTRF